MTESDQLLLQSQGFVDFVRAMLVAENESVKELFDDTFNRCIEQYELTSDETWTRPRIVALNVCIILADRWGLWLRQNIAQSLRWEAGDYVLKTGTPKGR